MCTHAHKDTHSAADSRNIYNAGCPPVSPLHLSQSTIFGVHSSFSCILCLQRLILPSYPYSAVCHRGDIASAAMATSQQDSGFFDISLKSLLKSLGGSEYS